MDETGCLTIHLMWQDDQNRTRRTLLKRIHHLALEDAQAVFDRARSANPKLELDGNWQREPTWLR